MVRWWWDELRRGVEWWCHGRRRREKSHVISCDEKVRQATRQRQRLRSGDRCSAKHCINTAGMWFVSGKDEKESATHVTVYILYCQTFVSNFIS